MGADLAQERAGRLSDADAAWMSERPERVQRAGYGEYGPIEVMLGLFFLVGGIVATYFWLND
jgi:hypothetical protein